MLQRVYFALLLGLAVVLPVAGLTSATARADDPAFLTIGAGWFDFNRQKDDGAEFRLDYRSDFKDLRGEWVVGPLFPQLTLKTNGLILSRATIND